MRLKELSVTVGAVLLLQGSIGSAKHTHNVLDRRHRHHNRESKKQIENELELRVTELEKRTGQCKFPNDAGLIAITPDQQNGGWAMSPDQPCRPNNYCPYACPPGQMMAQWNPEATSYTYPQSMDGGLYCDSDGSISKPFPDKDYCMSGTGNVGAVNKANDVVSFCQTVLPGNEAMLIPTSVGEFETLTVPGPNYWCSTAAHFYINPPGIGTEEACVWGSKDSPVGNWSPYVAGANTDHSGQTFVKLAWNPIYLEPATPFRNKMPTWGVEIQCDGDCNGLPCRIDPDTNNVNEMVGASTVGVGGASFCVVTVPKGVNANFVVFEGRSSGGGSSSGAGSSSGSSPAPSAQYQQNAVVHQSASPSAAAPSSPPSSSSAPSSTSSSPPSTTPDSSSSSSPSTKISLASAPSSSAAASSTAAAAPTSTLASASASASASSPASAASSTAIASIISTSSVASATSTNDISSLDKATSSGTIASSTVFTSSYPSVSNSPHVLIQNNTSGYSGASLSPASSTAGAGSGSGSEAGSGGSGSRASAAVGSAASSNPARASGYKRNVTGAGLCLSFLAAIMVYSL